MEGKDQSNRITMRTLLGGLESGKASVVGIQFDGCAEWVSRIEYFVYFRKYGPIIGFNIPIRTVSYEESMNPKFGSEYMYCGFGFVQYRDPASAVALLTDGKEWDHEDNTLLNSDIACQRGLKSHGRTLACRKTY